MTPGNLRGFVRAKLRKVKDGSMFEHRFRSEDMVERASLDEREMQYLYKDGAGFCFMDTDDFEQIHMSEEALGDSMNYLLPEATIKVEFYEGPPVGIELPATVDLKRRGHRARHQGRDGERAGQAGDGRDRPRRHRARLHQQRRPDSREHRDGRVSEQA